MPDLSSVRCGSLSLAAGLMSHSLVFMAEIFVHREAEGANVIGRASTARAQNVDAGFEQRRNSARHLLWCFVVDDFHVDQLRLAGVGLYHHRQARHFAISL